LVHRDVKPANILISGEGEHEHVYLTDFGLTKRLGSAGSLTRTGAWVGTPDYVAPEQIQAQTVDGRADVYSLGCVLYEMLTGSVAFPKDNDMAKLWAHVTDPPPSPSLKRPGLVKAFDDVVARATAKDPAERYARASELAAAVDRAAAEQNAQLSAGLGPDALQPTRAAQVPSLGQHDVFISQPSEPGPVPTEAGAPETTFEPPPAEQTGRVSQPPPPVSPPDSHVAGEPTPAPDPGRASAGVAAAEAAPAAGAPTRPRRNPRMLAALGGLGLGLALQALGLQGLLLLPAARHARRV
jgi:serine/threonine protein kinase